MKGYFPCAVFFIACLAAPFGAQACENFQAKADRYTALKRQGGSAKQMNRWTAQRKTYNAQYRECLKAQPRIQAFSPPPKKLPSKTLRQAQRNVETDNPITLQLLKTCNFWIDTHNATPSAHNRSYRDSACRALDDSLANAPALVTNQTPPRSAKDCVKPGNLFDDDVYECMAGARAPDWR